MDKKRNKANIKAMTVNLAALLVLPLANRTTKDMRVGENSLKPPK
ncbi:MAG TPA: hypothetical protein VF393_05055 [archaeon]